MSNIIEGITKDLKAIPKNLKAKAGGMDTKNCIHFSTHEAMAQKLRSVAKPGDVLLFKGSRGMRMEQVLDAFLQEEK